MVNEKDKKGTFEALLKGKRTKACSRKFFGMIGHLAFIVH